MIIKSGTSFNKTFLKFRLISLRFSHTPNVVILSLQNNMYLRYILANNGFFLGLMSLKLLSSVGFTVNSHVWLQSSNAFSKKNNRNDASK